MNKICFINGWSSGSTGNIIKDISNLLVENKIYSTCYIFREKNKSIKTDVLYLNSNFFSYKFQRLKTFILGNDGFCNNFGTKRAIKFLRKEKPQIVHIHNIHGSFINIGEIIKFCVDNSIKIVWTLHDEWLVTGRCCCFLECDCWQDKCKVCPHKNYYPSSIRKNVRGGTYRKENIVNLMHDKIIFVSPSKWLFNVVKQRFPYANVKIINNGIDQQIYRRTKKNPQLIKMSKGRKIIGVAAYLLTREKGLNFIIDLSKRVNKEKCVIVAVGARKKDIKRYSNTNLILLPRLNSRDEMAQFYSTIDCFLNPTLSDTFSMTNIECMSCGTPVICFNTGGAVEMIKDGVNGYVIKQNDIESAVDKINLLFDKRLDENLIANSVSKYSRASFVEKYLELYNHLIKEQN